AGGRVHAARVHAVGRPGARRLGEIGRRAARADVPAVGIGGSERGPVRGAGRVLHPAPDALLVGAAGAARARVAHRAHGVVVGVVGVVAERQPVVGPGGDV